MRVAPIQPIPTRLPQRPGVLPEKRRKVTCSCGAVFSSAKPQDPDLKEGQGTCIDCRDMAAVEWAKKNGKTINDGVTRFSRYA